MVAKILDGALIAKEVRKEVKETILNLKQKSQIIPKLVVVMVGQNYSSLKYVNKKNQACRDCGIDTELITLPENIEQKELYRVIEKLNNDETVHAILIQFPLPRLFKKRDVMLKVSAKKDADGFNPLNMGRLAQDNPQIEACTPQGVMYLLEKYNVPIEGKHAVIIGRSQIVGRPMALMLLNYRAVVTITHRYTQNLEEYTKLGDILISATGRPKSINKDMIKDGAVCIDIGISKDQNQKLSGDFDENAKEKASWITPVPGGIGPMTVAMLMKNVCKLYQAYLKENNYI